jgi:hypothetical protein
MASDLYQNSGSKKPETAAPQQAAPQNFSQMQKAGFARPAPVMYAPAMRQAQPQGDQAQQPPGPGGAGGAGPTLPPPPKPGMGRGGDPGAANGDSTFGNITSGGGPNVGPGMEIGDGNYQPPSGGQDAGGGAAPQTFDLGQILTQLFNNRQGQHQFTPNPTGFDAQLQTALQNRLQNPSAYNSDVVRGTYDQLSGRMDEQFRQDQGMLREEMARRGVDASTIHGGRLGDLVGYRDRNRSFLAQQLLDKQASTYGSDLASAISGAMGYSGQNFDQQRDAFGANLQANDQAFRQQQDLLGNIFGFGQQQFENQMDVDQMNHQFDMDEIMQIIAQLGLT